MKAWYSMKTPSMKSEMSSPKFPESEMEQAVRGVWTRSNDAPLPSDDQRRATRRSLPLPLLFQRAICNGSSVKLILKLAMLAI